MTRGDFDWQRLAAALPAGAVDPQTGRLRPPDAAALAAVLAHARRTGLSLWLPRPGAEAPPPGHLPLDLSRLADFEPPDPVSWTVRVGVGLPLATLAERLARHGFALPCDEFAPTALTLGQALADPRHVDWGPSHGPLCDQLLAVEGYLPDGQRYATPAAPRRATGPDLTALFVGTSTPVGVVAAVTLAVRPRPDAPARVCWHGTDAAAALQGLRALCDTGPLPDRVAVVVAPGEPGAPAALTVWLRFCGAAASVADGVRAAAAARPAAFTGAAPPDATPWPVPAAGFGAGPTLWPAAFAAGLQRAAAGDTAVLGRFDSHLATVAPLAAEPEPRAGTADRTTLLALAAAADPTGVLGRRRPVPERAHA